jgi:hypothetical protein
MAAGTGALLVAIGGGAAGVAALTKDDKDAPRVVTAVGQAAQGAPNDAAGPRSAPAKPLARVPAEPDPAAAAARLTDQADRTGPRTPRRDDAAAPPAVAKAAPQPAGAAPAGPRQPAAARPPAPAAPAGPQTSTRTEVETREIPFQTRLVRDPGLPRGSKRIEADGIPGEESLRYQVTVVDGQVTDRRLVDITVTRRPEPRVVAFGTGRHGRPDRGCRGGRGLDLCVPLGRSAVCPDVKDDRPRRLPENTVVVLDQDLELVDPAALDRLTC